MTVTADPTTTAALWLQREKSIADATAAVVNQAWATIDPAAISESFVASVGPAAVQATTAGQISAADGATSYVSEIVKAYAVPDPVGTVVARAFGGVASDGQPLATLLHLPVIEAKTRIAAGQTAVDALAAAGKTLEGIVLTQVHDAGRAATAVAMVADPNVIGYVRELRGASCDRCIVLAGRIYKHSQGFLRHPRCDCQMRPITKDEFNAHKESVVNDPKQAFNAMSKEAQDHVFGKANAEAIRQGADISQVVNAKSGVYVAGGKQFTTAGTSKRALASQRLKDIGVTRRMTPEQILKEAGDNRNEAIRLLKQNGYIKEGYVKPPPPPEPLHGPAVLPKAAPKPVAPVSPTESVPQIGKGGTWVDPNLHQARTTDLHAVFHDNLPGDDVAVRAKIDVMNKVTDRAVRNGATTEDIIAAGYPGELSELAAKQLHDPDVIWVKDPSAYGPKRALPGWRAATREEFVASGQYSDSYLDTLLARRDISRATSARETMRAFRGGSDELLTELRHQSVSAVIGRWAGTSGDTNPGAVAVQSIASKMFGIPNAWMPHKIGGTSQIARDVQRLLNDEGFVRGTQHMLRAQYELTQEAFKAAGIQEVVLTRGIHMNPTLRRRYAAQIDAAMRLDPSTASRLIEGLPMQPLSSFAWNIRTAEGFGGYSGVVLKARVPVSQILSYPRTGFGCFNENELVVIAQEADVIIEKAMM